MAGEELWGVLGWVLEEQAIPVEAYVEEALDDDFRLTEADDDFTFHSICYYDSRIICN